MPDARRRELAEFLRSRRERLTPEEAGLPLLRRRRTPGLRREDVADLAGIGTAWYTWLEQARDIRPSEATLRRIARALKLDAVDERYFLGLALTCVPEQSPNEEIVPPDLEGVLEGFRGPAYVKGRRWDLLAFNALGDRTFGFGQLTERNLLRNLFRPEARARYPNWPAVAHQQVAMFRADCAGILTEPWIQSLVDELNQTSGEFRTWWTEQVVEEMSGGHQTYEHPEVGELSLDFTTLKSAESPNLRVVVFLPEDDETRQKLRRLAG
jgi:transcriptional regulator with XRE-family HTH domain